MIAFRFENCGEEKFEFDPIGFVLNREYTVTSR